MLHAAQDCESDSTAEDADDLPGEMLDSIRMTLANALDDDPDMDDMPIGCLAQLGCT